MFASALLAMLAIVSATPVDEKDFPERPVFEPPTQKQMSEPAAADPFTADALLRDVCFADSQNGWAVGDRGAIWHTADGGKKWERQNSGVRCPLHSVCFLDDKTGYAAGGFAVPYSHQGAGVFLFTHDGGRTWTHSAKIVLPAIKRIGFFDAARGWAVATPSAMFPSGAMTTDDRGKSWKPLIGPGSSGWLAGDFLDPRNAAMAGRNGAIGQIASGGVEPPRENAFGLKNLRQIRLGARRGWLVGDVAAVSVTDDAGGNWHPPEGVLPEGAAENFDFAALAVRGEKIWIAGTPGTAVFHSSDGGKTWTPFATDCQLPLHAMTFADDEHGWAVGSLGTILATADGGRTWQLQRSGGSRAAILGLFAEAEDIPLEFFAKYSAQDGFLSTVEAIARRDVESPSNDETPPADRLHQAVVEVGASEGFLAWNFPLRQKGIQLTGRQFADGWDRANDGRGLAELKRHLVRQIRLWRPDAIVTHDNGTREADPLRQLIGRVVLQAVEEAADPQKQADQIRRAGLSPWQVKKVFAAKAVESRGSNELTTSQLAPRLGGSLTDVAADPRGLFADSFIPGPSAIALRSLFNRDSKEEAGRGAAAGFSVPSEKDSHREMLDPPAENVADLHRAAMKLRNAQAIIDLSARNELGAVQLLAQTDSLIAGLDESTSGRIVFQIGDTYRRSGRWPMAAEAFRAMIERYPNHPLSKTALVWLMRYYSSGEAAYRERREGTAELRQAKGETFGQSANAAGPQPNADRFDLAIALGKEIERKRADVFADPLFRFPLASVERQKNESRQGVQYYLAESRSPRRDAWAACAQGEMWIADRKEKTTKPLIPCLSAAKKPKLDGVLDEEFWQKAKPVPLQSALHDDEDWPACAALAYDEEFLYIAISCRKKGREERGEGRENIDESSSSSERAGASPPPVTPSTKSETLRTHDADLSNHDRVDILLDIDRDYATYYRFTVDDRGWTVESCWDDASWNPEWFVAASETEETWMIEAAIPLAELVSHPPKSHDVWAIGIQRTIPGVGFQSWSAPASTDILPEGFGFLIFD